MNRDTELQLLLSKIRNAKTTDQQISKWNAAVEKELSTYPITRIRRFSWATQLAAVLTTGFLLGFFLPGNSLRMKKIMSQLQPLSTLLAILIKRR